MNSSLEDIDAILEPNVIQTLKEYIASGQGPNRVQEAIHTLSSSYQGLPQMVNLIQDWNTNSNTNDSNSSTTKQAMDDQIRDYLRELTVLRFDPSKADEIFSQGSSSSSGIPPWLVTLIQDPSWTPTFTQLAEEHSNCLLVKFALDKISQQQQIHQQSQDTGGSMQVDDDDVDNVIPSNCVGSDISGSSNSSTNIGNEPLSSVSLSQFHMEFLSLLQQTISFYSNSNTDSNTLLDTFLSLCCLSEYSYIYSHRLLFTLSQTCSRDNNTKLASVLQCISQRLSLFRSREGGKHHSPIEMELHTRHELQIMGLSEYPDLEKALKSLARGHRLLPLDAENLHLLYASSHPPPIAFLRLPEVLTTLLTTLFDYRTDCPSPEHLPHYIFLLLRLCNDSSASGEEISTKMKLETEKNATFPNLKIEKITTLEISAKKRKLLKTTANDLTTASKLCKDRSFGLRPSHTFNGIHSLLHVPSVAVGVLTWVSSSLLDPSYFETSFQTSTTPLLVSLLAKLASKHVQLRPRVVDILFKALQLVPQPLEAMAVVAYHRDLLRALVQLVLFGQVERVLDKLSSVIGGMDHALVRFFFVKLLQSVDIPYSDWFVRRMSELLNDSQTRVSFASHPKSRAVVDAFLSFT